MTDYLSYNFSDNEEFISTYDELPLWSAPFGLLLLKHLQLKPNLTVLDIGSGAGFPLMELAGRLGRSCKLYGMDPWINANKRAKQKIKNYALPNVEIIEGSAEHIPFEDNSVDLIVSNLGINNFDKPEKFVKECNRVLKPDGRLTLTTNLNGHWKEFYTVFESTLEQFGKSQLVEKLKMHCAHRGSVESVSKLFTENGFTVSRQFDESFEMNFLDGSAFLNHHFVKLCWLGSWKELLTGEDIKSIFTKLEENLNASTGSGCLQLTVPMAFIEGIKI
jgi:ubiquinone/menaquinone biosynthesis C-methylase UbiE